MSDTVLFWECFGKKDFVEAEQIFSQLSSKAKQEVFATLFQQSQNQAQPHSVSVLFRKLHEGKEFDDFYQAWYPPKHYCDEIVEGGETYQQFFTVPIRVINAVNVDNPDEVVSIGLHWMTDQDLEVAMSDAEFAKRGAERGEKIATVAQKEQTGVYKVMTDDNLGSAF